MDAISFMQERDYQRIERAIAYIDGHVHQQPTLAEIANSVHLSPFHFNRMFKRWAGITPKQYLKHLTLKTAKSELDENSSVLQAAFGSGLSGPGRLHDLFVSVDAVTPGEYKSGGAGLTIRYGDFDSPFGRCFVALSDRGICAISFPDKNAINELVTELQKDWPAAVLKSDEKAACAAGKNIFDRKANTAVKVLLNGSNFQIKVWEALLSVPEGTTTTYGELAESIGNPNGSRAVGNAVGANRLAFIVPCHRVLRKSGALGGYRWGQDRKRAMLAWEDSLSLGKYATGA